jgi:hypothetical protein
VEKHLQDDFLYSRDERDEDDVIAALHCGVFQCSFAPIAMVGILRDIYHIPARAVGGYRAKKLIENGRVSSVLQSPATGHAWVEVYYDGRWHTFDPTPRKFDKKPEQKDKNALPDIEPDDHNDKNEKSKEQGPTHDKKEKQHFRNPPLKWTTNFSWIYNLLCDFHPINESYCKRRCKHDVYQNWRLLSNSYNIRMKYKKQ